MSKLVLYGHEASPPTRGVRMVLQALDIPYEFKVVDLKAGEHKTGELSKHHPNPKVPALQDGDTWLWESHVISGYLVDKYGKSDELYPKDLVKRAIVDERLYFDASVLQVYLALLVRPLMQNKGGLLVEQKLLNITEAYGTAEQVLKLHKYMAGNQLTIADFLCLATITALNVILPIDSEKYVKLSAWHEDLTKLPHFEELNGNGLLFFKHVIKPLLQNVEN